MITLRLILGDQLNARHSWYKNKNDDVIYLVAELKQELTYTTHHIQKVAAFFMAMEQFATALALAGHRVLHFNLEQTSSFNNLPALLESIINEQKIDKFEYQLPDEFRLRTQLAEFSDNLAIASACYDTEHFYLANEELKQYFKANTSHRLEHFYRKMRVRFNVLMEGEQPTGQQWNFDKNNRNKLKQDDLINIPEPLLFDNDPTDVLARLNKHDITTIGRIDETLPWPVNRKQALQLLTFFCEFCLANFGKFQDALTGKLRSLGQDRGWSLYHSRLSFALNSKILSPILVVETVINYYQAHKQSIDLAQIEGFVRQILGWREFVRGIYWANMPDYQELNHLNATSSLPSWFWSGNTKMTCMSHAIEQSLEFAYAHHIQRLMITGNFCLLTGIEPEEVDEWYLGIYIDAIEWVELPNTRGMSQFADGGIVGSKAYAASGNYINKMSDYCKDCYYDIKKITGQKACPFNSLYWHFMVKHQQKIGNNPRNAMVYKNWLKRSEQDQKQILAQANQYLIDIELL